jgi:hypothetical protein
MMRPAILGQHGPIAAGVCVLCLQPMVRLPRVSDSHPSAVRCALGGLLAFDALNAVAGGCYGLCGAKGVPTR